MQETDEELMMRVARKDHEEALVALIEKYRGPLVNHFMRRGVQHEYEDLAQETFVRLYKARKRYRVRAKFRTYLYHIAHRVWVDHVRKSSRKTRRETAFRDEPRPESGDAPDMHGHDVDWALSQLSPPHRDVVVYSVFDQLSHEEIAEIMDIPEGTVKSRLHHALRKLREIFAGEQP
ncbi:MAG: RNA polymerase sigma factor [Verrucomicrobia bacterium]|nr:RNA polymerase sigma factor [Verrucomicrobiota bacterium]MCH8513837.1 RNA polymerase sigma factor [Kiritimatiellia bacterium]